MCASVHAKCSVHVSSGKQTGWSKENVKEKAFGAPVFWFDRVCLTLQYQEMELCVRSVPLGLGSRTDLSKNHSGIEMAVGTFGRL